MDLTCIELEFARAIGWVCNIKPRSTMYCTLLKCRPIYWCYSLHDNMALAVSWSHGIAMSSALHDSKMPLFMSAPSACSVRHFRPEKQPLPQESAIRFMKDGVKRQVACPVEEQE